MEQQTRKPLTSAEKVRRYREKRKNDEEYKKSENVRIEKIRKERLNKMSEKQRDDYRDKATERQRQSRARKKGLTTPKSKLIVSTTLLNPYSSKQSLGKALSKSRKSLPWSPRKRKAIVAGLAADVGLNLELKMDRHITKINALSQSTKDKVRDFFFRPDISYTTPGMNDTMTVWEEGKKMKLRKYCLNMYLREAHYIYCGIHDKKGEFGIGYSAFCSLRPKNVLLLSDSPKDQCKCMVHENLFLKLSAIGISYDSNFWKDALCSDSNESNCWLNQCDECQNGKKILPKKPLDSLTRLHQWEKMVTEKEVNGQKKSTTKLQCNAKDVRVSEVCDMLKQGFADVCYHIVTKRIQANQFELDKEDKHSRVLQMDFAMAYECAYQHEPQGALWSRASVNLYTAAVTYQGQTNTYIICSDTKNKDKDTVLVFVEHLYEKHIIGNDDADDINEIIWTDGPSSEFKNKYIVELLRRLSKKYKKTFRWRYFATSHGKGVVDGVGGNCKSIVREKTFSKGPEKLIVQNAEDFAKAAKKLVPKTTVLYITQEQIDEEIKEKQPFVDVPTVSGILKMHAMQCKPEHGVMLWKNCLYVNDTPHIHIRDKVRDVHGPAEPTEPTKLKEPTKPTEPTESTEPTQLTATTMEYNIGDWVVVTYDGIKYPGEVTGVRDADVVVSTMHRAGNYYKWPDTKDEIAYTFENIVCKVGAPVVCGTGYRVKFSFDKF